MRSDGERTWHGGCVRERLEMVPPDLRNSLEVTTMKKLTVIKLEKRIAPRYVPF